MKKKVKNVRLINNDGESFIVLSQREAQGCISFMDSIECLRDEPLVMYPDTCFIRKGNSVLVVVGERTSFDDLRQLELTHGDSERFIFGGIERYIFVNGVEGRFANCFWKIKGFRLHGLWLRVIGLRILTYSSVITGIVQSEHLKDCKIEFNSTCVIAVKTNKVRSIFE